MRKFAYIIGMVLELALVAGVFILDHFVHAKLGMNRWLGYHNQKWEAALPIGTLQAAAAVILVVLLVVAAVAFAKSSPKRALPCVSIVVAGVLTGVYAWFSASFTPGDYRAYFLMSLCLALAALLQGAQALSLAFGARKRLEPGARIGKHARYEG